MRSLGFKQPSVATAVRPLGAVLGVFALWASFGFVETGEVGVRSTLKQVDAEEIMPGLYFKYPWISTVTSVIAKEIEVPLVNLTPKAKDNLSLRDLDVSVYYTVAPSGIADLTIKYALQTASPELATPDGTDVRPARGLAPAYTLVKNVSREAVYTAVASRESLTLHQNREVLATDIQRIAQAKLDADDKGVFQVTRVVIRQALTDPSIEKSIQDAVANQKRLEAMAIQVDIARKEAEVEVIRADGIAKAQQIIANTLTREYLVHERNKALQAAAEKGTLTTMVVPEGSTPFIGTGK